MNRTLSGLALVAFLTIPATALAKDAGGSECMHELDHDQVVEPQVMLNRSSAGPVRVYLNKSGGTLTGGWDNSESNTSALVRGHGFDELDVPKYSGSRSKWKRTLACVQNKFADFDIEVTDERPEGDDYIMAMLGGRPSMLGYPRGVSGVAPFTGRVIPQGVVFVFERSLRSNVRATCDSTAHEIGHALGLEHQYLCEDTMSYLNGCGEKSFQNETAWCGEFSERECNDGGQQNTYKHLADTLGLKSGGGPVVADNTSHRKKPAPAREPDLPDTSDSSRDDDAPSISILSPDRDVLDGNDQISILAEVDDRKADVELLWATPDGNFLMKCNDMPENIPATCKRKGQYVVFSLDVGVGERAFAMRATDASGNESWSGLHWLWFDGE